MEKLKYELKDIIGVRNSKPGRQKHPLKRKYKGLNLSAVAIGHVDPNTGKVCLNELINHPTIIRMQNNNI